MKEAKQLYKKYNYPVPRYTSYPPANHFKDGFTSEDYKIAIEKSNDHKPENISIYIHIPFCKKLCHYCGCFKSPLNDKDKPLVDKYIEGLKKEIHLSSKFINKKRKLSQIHYGGGTPNAISLDKIAELNKLILSEYDLISGAEIAIECNPAYITFQDIDLLSEMGFNRISLGIQDFNKEVLKIVNREESLIELSELITYIRKKANPMMVNLDFIYGLPLQTIKSFQNTVAKAIELKPDRLVTFSYAHVPWVNKAQDILERVGLPNEEDKIDMYFNTREQLKKANYIPIGFDHYVLEHDEMNLAYKEKKLHRNFQGYCTRKTTGQVYAYGVSSISQLERAYIQNTKATDIYLEKLDQDIFPVEKGYLLTENEVIVRDVITYLLSNNQINLEETAKKLNITFSQLENILNINYEVLKELENDEIIKVDNHTIEITEMGILFARNVASALDPNYQKVNNRYSKPV